MRKKSKQDLLRVKFDVPVPSTSQNVPDKSLHKYDRTKKRGNSEGSKNNPSEISSSNSNAIAKIVGSLIPVLKAVIQEMEWSEGPHRLEIREVSIIRVFDNAENIVLRKMADLKIDKNTKTDNKAQPEQMGDKVTENNETAKGSLSTLSSDPRVFQNSSQSPTTTSTLSDATRHPTQATAPPSDKLSPIYMCHSKESTLPSSSTQTGIDPTTTLTDPLPPQRIEPSKFISQSFAIKTAALLPSTPELDTSPALVRNLFNVTHPITHIEVNSSLPTLADSHTQSVSSSSTEADKTGNMTDSPPPQLAKKSTLLSPMTSDLSIRPCSPLNWTSDPTHKKLRYLNMFKNPTGRRLSYPAVLHSSSKPAAIGPTQNMTNHDHDGRDELSRNLTSPPPSRAIDRRSCNSSDNNQGSTPQANANHRSVYNTPSGRTFLSQARNQQRNRHIIKPWTSS